MADGQLLPERAIRELNEVKKIVLGQTRTNRARRRRRRGGAAEGGGTFQVAIVRATAIVPAATGFRIPGKSSSYDIVKGDSLTGDLENWSLTQIAAYSYLVVIPIGGSNVIVSAFC